jgi:hypothetical protein
MKRFLCVGVILLLCLGSVASAFAEIKETEKERGGSDLQNVHDRVLCVDGFKVFQTIVFGFIKDGGAAVSNIQLMEEKNGILVPVRCSE